MFNWKPKATNAIYLKEDNGGKGRPFESRFIESGLVKYSFGVCLLTKKTIDKFINSFVGCPVIIDHQDVTDENAKDERVGVISEVWYNEKDGWFWCKGIIFDDEAIDLIKKGYTVSCQYEITEYQDNTENKLHNGNEFDKYILNGQGEHLAIVKNPRYENAYIAVNNADELKADEDVEWITVKGNHIPVKKGQSREDAIEQFIEDKRTGAYSDRNKSNRSIVAELEGKDNITTLSKKLKIPSKELKDTLFTDEWHHTNKNYTKTNYYYTDAYLDLQKKGEITQENIDKYNLNNFQIRAIKDSWGKLETKLKRKDDNIIDKLKDKFKNDKILSDIFSKIDDRAKKNDGLALEEVRRYYNEYIKGERDYSSLIENISFFSEEERAKRKQAKNEIQESDKMFNFKKEKNMDEIKEMLNSLLVAYKAKNEADKEDDKKEDDKKAMNENVDKRKLIDEIGGILKGKVDDELWRTIIGKAEKLAYDKSEVDTADNKCKNKCKNEDDEAEYEDLKEDTKESAENKKAKNSIEEMFYNGNVKTESNYISQKKAIELGKELF